MVSVGELLMSASVGFVRQGFGQAEVQHLHGAVGGHLDVGGLQIAVDDALVVRVLERVGHLPRDGQRFVERNRPAADALRQRRAFDQFHHQRADWAGFFQAVDGRDVRMIERRQELGFALEAGHALGIAGEGLGQDLQRDVAIEASVAGAVDFAHAAGAEERDDLVGADLGAGAKHAERSFVAAGSSG